MLCNFVSLCLCSVFVLCLRNEKFKAQRSIKFYFRGIDFWSGQKDCQTVG